MIIAVMDIRRCEIDLSNNMNKFHKYGSVAIQDGTYL